MGAVERSLDRRLERDVHGEGATSPELAVHMNPAAHERDELPRNRKPESRTFHGCAGLGDLMKRLEHALDVLRGNADAAVDDRKIQAHAGTVTRRAGHVKANLPRR